MGSAAAVGVVGLVAGVGYWLLSPDNVTAQCAQEDTNGQPVIVPDSYCTGHTAGMNGFFFWGGHQYRYYYGSSGSVGSTADRRLDEPSPSGAHVTTKSGTTIQRGGIGGQRRRREQRLVKRGRTEPRPNWQSIVESQGLVYGTPARDASGADRPYWDESVYYEFEMDEILALEADVELVHSMCLNAVEQVVLMERYKDFGLPEWSWPHIAESWRRSDPHVYGRFDLRYDGRRPAVLLEYNADTPTTLLEAAIVQWYWLKDKFPEDDQWNSLHEQLVDRWKAAA